MRSHTEHNKVITPHKIDLNEVISIKMKITQSNEP